MTDEKLTALIDALWEERVLFLGQIPAFARRELLEADVTKLVEDGVVSSFHEAIKHYEAQLQG